jgi:hypothetical protein
VDAAMDVRVLVLVVVSDPITDCGFWVVAALSR